MKLRSLLVGILLGTAGTSIAATLGGSAIFPDVAPGSYYDLAIGDLYRAGIITGYQNGKFGPNDPVTRGQVAVMLERLRAELGLVSDSVSSSSRPRSSASSSSSESFSSVATPSQGSFRFTLASYTVDENEGIATISVVRTGGNRGAVGVTYSLVAETALPGTDYEAAIANLSFADKETSATFRVKIIDDTSADGDKTLKMVLSAPTGGAILSVPFEAILTIKDNEASTGTSSSTSTNSSTSSNASAGGQQVGFSAREYAVAENGGSLTVTVERKNGTSGTVSVNYATSNGTGQSGSEYAATQGTLTFNSGESTKTFSIPITDDSIVDGNKTFTLTLTIPVGVTLGDGSATVSIYDNEAGAFGSGSLMLTKSNYTAAETDGVAIIEVTRSGGANGTVSVPYGTTDGTATAGADYTATSGTLTFAHGEVRKAFRISLTKDTLSDSGETVNISLGAPTGATLGTPSIATLTIFD
jgi:hypothetical protein